MLHMFDMNSTPNNIYSLCDEVVLVQFKSLIMVCPLSKIKKYMHHSHLVSMDPQDRCTSHICSSFIIENGCV
jgi:hypothetical protein